MEVVETSLKPAIPASSRKRLKIRGYTFIIKLDKIAKVSIENPMRKCAILMSRANFVPVDLGIAELATKPKTKLAKKKGTGDETTDSSRNSYRQTQVIAKMTT